MRIESSELQFQSQYQAYERTETQERLSVWNGNRQAPAAPSATAASAFARANETRVSISSAARFSLSLEGSGSSQALASLTNDVNDMSGDPVLDLLKSMIEKMTGQVIRIFSSADMPPVHAVPNLAAPASGSAGNTASNASGSGGQSMAYDAHYLHEETEQMSFSAQGVIRTADGQEIRFNLDLSMERHYSEESSVSIRTGEAARQDPLVVNFAGNAAQLTDRFIEFDLDGNGSAERLPGLARGSAFLVLDRNGDGRIDTGNELFGPRSQHGFRELAALDADDNGWIDEADPLFEQLRLWNPDTDGGALRSLAAADIGALALARTSTPFSLRGEHNADLGKIRDTGIYLRPDGSAGTVQEVDLSVG